MRFSKHLHTVAVLAAGGVLGFVAASSSVAEPARADAARSVRVVTTEPATNAPTEKAACCDVKLDRTLALADQIAEANAVTLAQVEKATKAGKKPNIVIIWGDDVGQSNISAYSMGLMGYHTPHIDR